jgi:Ca2+-binding RTX toxin-like protein
MARGRQPDLRRRPGDDVVFGERGNDSLLGNEGDDRLYGGIGDDLLRGGPGQDQLAGGHGADSIDGDGGDDYVRGDGTIDRIFDTGGGTDTLSYATGITPGFGGDMSAFPGFPAPSGERGVRLNLGAPGQNGENGTASFGGGVDEVEGPAFERVIGTAFSDYIVGTDGSEAIYGGGGADVLIGEGGNDTLAGGADGDHLDGAAGSADSLDGGPGEDHCEDGETTVGCAAKGAGVVPRDSSRISVGTPLLPGVMPRSQLYLVGSTAADLVATTYAAGSPASVTFETRPGSTGSFDPSPAAASGCGAPTGSSPERVVCTLSAPLESIVIAGMAGADELDTAGFPPTVSVVLLGGAGNDDLSGGDATEDVLVDGDASTADADVLTALGRDDALLHTAGADTRLGGEGNDLFLSTSICDGDDLRGEGGRDNGSWARLGEAVHASLELGLAGRPAAGAAPQCGTEQVDSLQTIEDLEGSGSADVLRGSSGPNQLLGWDGSDSYFAAEGDDTILANSGDSDAAIDCGAGSDRALLDLEGNGYDDPPPVGCEQVEEAAINSFRFQLPPPPPPDETPPETVFSSGPAEGATIADSSPTFEFTSTEPGSSFECKIDAGSFTGCTSPHTTSPLGDGPHTFYVRATDAADNTDGTPASRSFTVATSTPTDTTAPETSIDSGPAGPTDDATPTFIFSSEVGASFECRLDGASFSPCSSPFTAAALAAGAHTFEVRAKDAAGNTDATPAARAFSVVLSPGPPGDPPGEPATPPGELPAGPAPPGPAPAPPPSSAFHFGRLVANRASGTATLLVLVPGPGSLQLRGKGLRDATRSTDSAGSVALPIRPRRGLMNRLRRDGSVPVSAIVTYLPAGGDESSRSRDLRLVQKPSRDAGA